jgi:hypothetical protein
MDEIETTLIEAPSEYEEEMLRIAQSTNNWITFIGVIVLIALILGGCSAACTLLGLA